MPDIRPDVTTHLYAQNRTAIDGAVNMYYYEVYAQWSGTGSLTMQTNVQAAGSYEAALCCSALADGVDVRLSVAGREARVRIDRTWGVWGDGKLDYNFERVPIPGTLDLPEGPATVTIAVTGGLPAKSFNVSSVELTPVAAKAAIAKTESGGLALKADTDWFVRAGYGLMFHWTSDTAPPRGPIKPYADAVRALDVNAWADMCEDTGAAYVFLTANHGTPHFPAPLKYWESVHPGLTTERDLIAEMTEALERRGMRLMLYLNCPTFGGLKTDAGRTLADYVDLCCRMFEEIGGRYGEHVAGYWLDSWYQPYIRYGWFPIQKVFAAAKARCPGRIVAFNHWVFPVPTLCQEYWAAELYKTLGGPPPGRYYPAGSARGLQSHALLAVDSHWGHSTLDTEMEPPVWSAEVLADYVRRYMANQGVVTMNPGIFQDGTIGPQTAAVLRGVRKAIRG